MRLAIRHHTTYRYDAPAEYAAQVLRLTPRPHHGLEVLQWEVRVGGGGRLVAFDDGFGNASHMHTVAHRHETLEVRVDGIVETRDTGGLLRGAGEPLPADAWRRGTRLTEPSPGIERLAADAARGGQGVLDRLMHLVAERVEYRRGATDATTTAAEALRGGFGVCQDQAHVFVSAARVLGIPARYVGGYLGEEADQAAVAEGAGHAWAEACDPDHGWTGYDPANRARAGDAHVRTSVGLDYESAAPVRGVRRDRRGLVGAEVLQVDVSVARMAGQ